MVYGAALQLLTVMVGYKYLFHVSHYSDELVVCFEHSLTKWAALTTRTCLHALTVCALELPISMRRMIPSVLVKLSQMASNPALALPMLELLSVLVHAADLSANFVEADYKRVFSVALQYLTAPVHMPPTAQDASALAVSATSQVATPQVAAYVRHLAMQILYVAYIGMRQADRRRYVPYITKGLLALQVDSSGRTSKGASQAALDEQREIILDLLARYTYANCQSKPTRSFVAEKLLEGAQSRRWVYGSSVLEISVAKGGWSEIVVRRSTGTVAWICRLENRYVRGQRGGSRGRDETLTTLPSRVHLSIHATAATVRSATANRFDAVSLPATVMLHWQPPTGTVRPRRNGGRAWDSTVTPCCAPFALLEFVPPRQISPSDSTVSSPPPGDAARSQTPALVGPTESAAELRDADLFDHPSPRGRSGTLVRGWLPSKISP